MQESRQNPEEPHTEGESPQSPETNEDLQAQPDDAEGREDTVDVTDLQEQLRAAEDKAAENYEALLRAKAEAENVRRRAQDDVAKASKFAIETFAEAMLPVKDSLEKALGTENQTLESLQEGVELTLKQLESAFEKSGINPENPEGDRFDPNKHEAISAIEADAEPNTVVEVLQKGYTLHDRVVRPALVVVAKSK